MSLNNGTNFTNVSEVKKKTRKDLVLCKKVSHFHFQDKIHTNEENIWNFLRPRRKQIIDLWRREGQEPAIAAMHGLHSLVRFGD